MIINRFKDNFITFLICIFPLSLITGPLIAEIIIFFVILIFFTNIFTLRNYIIFKNFYFIYFGFYIIYLLFISLISDYRDEIFIKNLFFFRFFLFVFSIYFFFQIKETLIKSLFLGLSLVLAILIFDGFYQYFFNVNILGYQQLRPDRVAGLFGDRLVLGSYLSKFVFIYCGLFFYFQSNMKNYQKIIYVTLILLTFIIIFISGDRAAFFITIFGFMLLFLFLNINLKKKIIVFVTALGSLFVTFSYNENIFDRYINQTIDQFNILSIKKDDNIFESFKYYNLTWQTAYKAFINKKIFGHGPKTFRNYCSDEKFITLSHKLSVQRNDRQAFEVHKKFMNVEVSNIFVKTGDDIDLDTHILNYEYRKNFFKFYSSKKGKATNILTKKGDFINPGHIILQLDLTNTNISPETYFYRDGCTTHPHQIYLQLLSETGLIGFLFIFLSLLYAIFCIIKFGYLKLFRNKIIYNNFQICIIVNLILFLFPFTTSGNFFNNWYTMLHLIQISVSLYAFQNVKKKSISIKNN